MLELTNLSFKIDDRIVLDGLNYVFLPNNIYVITGANGSGKSTLAKIIMGLTKPTQGSVALEKQVLDELTVDQRAKLGISLSFQQPVRFKGVSVRDLLNIATNSLVNDDQGLERLSQVGLSIDYLDRQVNDRLSGGELKRIELATTLARQPKVAIFDEPESGIDLWSFDQLTQVFTKAKAKNRLIIIISHQEKILRLADKILILNDGNITEYSNYQTFIKSVGESR